MPEAPLSLVQDIVWYSQQRGVHPKWRSVVEIASGKVPTAGVACFSEFDPAERSAPQINRETLLRTAQP
jgi:hypothetical protein